MLIPLSENIKQWFDGVSITSFLAFVYGYLPHATVVFTFLWAAIRFFETKTVQKLLRKVFGRAKKTDA